MKRMLCLLALSASCAGLLGVGLAMASSSKPMGPSFESVKEGLVASRLRNRLRFRVSASRYRRSGFARGGCPTGSALVIPEAEDQARAPSYLTASSHPTFFIHVPALPEASGIIYIETADSASRNPQVYKAAFDLAEQAGIVGIKMPGDAPVLEEGSTYQWRVTMSCRTEDGPGLIVLRSGEVTRVADVSGTAEERLDYYLDEGIWQETAEILAIAHHQNSSVEADEDWAAFMEASGLSQFVDTPILGMVNSRLLEE